MLRNPSDEILQRDQNQEPIIEILEDLAPVQLHTAAWATCMGKGWKFGHGSREGGWSRFWRMDLDNDSAFDEIWRRAQPRCEALAGAPLKVLSQYANGHTYGLGGMAHIDTSVPGSFTLLYYVNPVWENGWDGETIFYDRSGEVALAVRPHPNRAVFFDSRILHNGRAPSRVCTELRVTVAYKLQIATASSVAVVGKENQASTDRRDANPPEPANTSASPEAAGSVKEISRDGASRVYSGQIEQPAIQQEIENRLRQLGETVRLPGFRAGKIPQEELRRRYGPAVRAEALKHLAAHLVEYSLPAGNVAGACELKSGADAGDMEVHIHATHLPSLPDPDFSSITIERLCAPSESPEIAMFLRNHIKTQVLDWLDSLYSIPLFRGLIECEFTAIWSAAKSEPEFPAGLEEQKALAAELSGVAERRLRLGLVISEIARRYGIRAAHGTELEDKVVDRLVSEAHLQDKQLIDDQLRALMDE